MTPLTLFLWTIAALVYRQTVSCEQWLGSCDYQKYTANGCEDELGAECDSATMQCRCKSGNWHIVDNRFCFPTTCPDGQYYDHNLGRCDNQRKASINSEENYCKHDFHCKGSHVRCNRVNDWNYRCVCTSGFVYDSATQECQRLEGLNGFCQTRDDCDKSRLRNLICIEGSCQCAEGFTYNHDIDGCESIQDVKKRDSDYRKMIYIFIAIGLFFGAALSIKIGTTSASSAQMLLLKRIIEKREEEKELERKKREQQQIGEEEAALEEIHVIDEESNDKIIATDKSERLIERETA